jgi:DNA-binding MarR family transcriptional regulator
MSKIKLKLGSEAENIAGFLLWQVSKLWQRHLTIALQDLKLPSTQAVILSNILRFAEEGEKVTQMRLSKAAKIDRMTTSQALRALERKGLITRVVPPSNLRAYHVQLTARGRKVAFEAIQRFATIHESFFRPLRREDAQFVEYLQKLIRANDFS